MRVVLFIFCLTFTCLLTCSSQNNIQHYKIRQGEFLASLNETGELDAVNSRIITIPFIGWKYGSRMKITELLDHGVSITAGDSIAQIDPSNVLKIVVEKESALEIERANLSKL